MILTDHIVIKQMLYIMEQAAVLQNDSHELRPVFTNILLQSV